MQTFDREHSAARRAAVGLALAALASLVLVAAGCGSNSAGPGVAQAPSSSTTTEQSQSDGSEDGNGSEDGSASNNPAAYSACMRSHGVPKFPDPDANGGFRLRAGPGTGIDPESAQFKAAANACRKFQPKEREPSPAQAAEDQAQMLKFSACMRSHGLRNFPDPKFSGGRASLRINKGSGLNPDSPQFKAAQKACEKLLPGAPTSAPSTQSGRS